MEILFGSLGAMLRSIKAVFVGTNDPREQIIDILNATIKRNMHGTYPAIVMIAEIDSFRDFKQRHSAKDVSHTFRILERRLKGDLFTFDVVRRLDGDQFAIAISPLRNLRRSGTLDLATQLQDLVSCPINIGDGNVQISISVGCAASWDLPGQDGNDLLEAARVAQIEAAKQGGSSLRMYSSAMADRIRARKDMLTEALDAIKEGAIHAFFQPQICLSTNEISGFEALARWDHKSRGMISPAEFLPVLEEAGMMRHLGLAMLRDALRALRGWDDAGFRVPHVSVNLSNYELRDPQLVDIIQMELDAFDLSPNRLVIEVLETVIARGSDDIIVRNLRSISKIGCCIDLDDFGTGHASITTIKRFAVNRIKIDRSFVTQVNDDIDQQQMVATILMIAQSLSIETLAEGVETSHEIEHLTGKGCGHAQGFAIARPLAPADTFAWIRAQPSQARKIPNVRYAR